MQKKRPLSMSGIRAHPKENDYAAGSCAGNRALSMPAWLPLRPVAKTAIFPVPKRLPFAPFILSGASFNGNNTL